MRSGTIWKAATVVGFMAALLLQGCHFTLRSPRSAYRKLVKNQQQFDAIIVPGFPFNGERWDDVMKRRVLWSWILYRNGFAKNIIYSGGPVYSPYCEARIMGLYAEQLGVPAQHIFFDVKAEHSTENVFYSYEVARVLGFKTIALATDYNQAILLKSFVRKRFGTRIEILPLYEDMVAPYMNQPDPVIDPAPALVPGARPMPEGISGWQRLMGTLGRHIPWAPGSGRRAAPL